MKYRLLQCSSAGCGFKHGVKEMDRGATGDGRQATGEAVTGAATGQAARGEAET